MTRRIHLTFHRNNYSRMPESDGYSIHDYYAFVDPGQSGNQMGFRVGVMFQNPRRPRGPKGPKGKKIQFDRRLVYGVATHNGRTAKGRKSVIESYMDEVGVNVLALQETKRTLGSEMWKVPGCVVFEHRPKKVEKGNLGIATIVRRDMFEEALEITEIRMWIRCGTGEKKLVMCNVYIPTVIANGKKEELIEWKLVRSRGE